MSRGPGIGIVNPLAAIDTNPKRIAFRPFVPQIMFRGVTLCPQLQQPNPVVQTFLEIVRTMMAEQTAASAGQEKAGVRKAAQRIQ